MIHICFGLHDADGRYSKFTGTTITSIFENTKSPVTAHILHDNTLTDDNRDKFLRLARRYNQRVEFHNIEQLCLDENSLIKSFFLFAKKSYLTVAATYRLLIPKIFPADIEKIIYLDSDIIVNLDITEFWQIELGDKILGVIPENFNGINTEKRFNLCRAGLVKPDDYFNSGVLLINVKLFRDEEKSISEGINFIIEHPECKFLDQEILNYCFSTRTLKLPAKFNRFIECVKKNNETVVEKQIYHYAGGRMGFERNDNFNRLWLKYFSLSTWCDAETFFNLYEKFQAQDTEIKNLLISLTSALSGRKRAFILIAEYLEPLKFVFGAKNSELIFIENFKDTTQLIKTLKKSRSQKVFLAMLPNYPLLRDLLTAEGFVENKDFFNGTKFLSKAHGWQIISSYPFIKAM